MIFGQQFIDAPVAKWSFYVELNRVLDWESITLLLMEIYPVGKKHRG